MRDVLTQSRCDPRDPSCDLCDSHFACEVLAKWDWCEGVAAMAFLHPERYHSASLCARVMRRYRKLFDADNAAKTVEILPGFSQIMTRYLSCEDVSSFIEIDSWDMQAHNDLVWPVASLDVDKSK